MRKILVHTFLCRISNQEKVIQNTRIQVKKIQTFRSWNKKEGWDVDVGADDKEVKILSKNLLPEISLHLSWEVLFNCCEGIEIC